MINAQVLENGTIQISESTVSDSVRYETIKFSFPQKWKSYTKTAVFSNGDTVLSVILNLDSELDEDECLIPSEVIKPPGFRVSVFGISGDSRATTTEATVTVINSGYGEGDEPSDPTPDEYEQLIRLANKTQIIAQSVRDDADSGAFNGKDGYTPVLGVDYVTIDQSTEYVFDGGNSDQSVPTVIMVDDTLSETSDNAIANKTVAQAINLMWSKIYPIGSIYISAVSTSPSTLFGGSWERIKDTFLLAAGDKYSAGAKGGEATHKLTVSEMPSHYHNSQGWARLSGGSNGNQALLADGIDTNLHTLSTGGGQAHNNMPPYLAVYVWKRTA